MIPWTPEGRGARIGLAGACMLVIVLAASWGSILAEPLAVDDAWQRLAASGRADWLVPIGLAIDTVGGGMWAVMVCALVAVAVGLASRSALPTTYLLGASVLCTLIVHAIKPAVDRGRPLDILVAVSDASYPSGHTAFAAVLLGGCALLARRWWAWILAILGILAVAGSRTLVGAHWLSDVTGGTLIGLASAMFAALLTRAVQERRTEEPQGSTR